MSQQKKILKETFKSWSPLAATIIILSATIFVGIHQNYRSSANDPQTQIVRELSTALSEGTPAESIVPSEGTVELKGSLSPFVLIYDKDNKLLGSSALENGKNPEFPAKILDKAKQTSKEQYVTWQPETGVRMAVVISKYESNVASGTVVAGRSLEEIEKRSISTLILTSIACVFALLVTFLINWLFKKMEFPHIETVGTKEEVI